MFDHIQDFHQPATVREAVKLLHDARGRARVLAGGTDLALLSDRSIRALVDVTRLGLDYIRRDGNAIVVGATCTMAALENSAVIRALGGGILAHAASTCGSQQIRNTATIGGNLAHGSPAADTATPLLAMDASVALQGRRGKRKLALADFFALPPKKRSNGDLLVEIMIPKPKGRTGWSFQKFGRTETDISLVNCAAGICIDRDGRCSFARIALGAVAPAPMRATKAEAILAGQPLTLELIARAAASARAEVQPLSDHRASADYRRELAEVLVRRALRECVKEAGCAL
ncbi:MAG: FAD binding domain-containing protein [Terriglobales bacterium]